jgi:hypothetical protein
MYLSCIITPKHIVYLQIYQFDLYSDKVNKDRDRSEVRTIKYITTLKNWLVVKF